MGRPYSYHGDWDSRVVATSIHNGHDLRPAVAELMVLAEEDRLREEDPHTGRLAAALPSHLVVHRSRFEVDLNRPREGAVYRTPADCWDLEVWRDTALPDDLVDGSLELCDAFHADLAERLDSLAAQGPFVLCDVHTYNHRRDGADAPAADPEKTRRSTSPPARWTASFSAASWTPSSTASPPSRCRGGSWTCARTSASRAAT